MSGSAYRRRCEVGRREPRGLLRYTDAEWAEIVRAAAVTGLRPGAWVQQVAHRAAVHGRHANRPDSAKVEALVAELRQHRRVLTNIGGNLKLARAANATNAVENPAGAAALLRMVARVVHSSDELLDRLRAELLR